MKKYVGIGIALIILIGGTLMWRSHMGNAPATDPVDDVFTLGFIPAERADAFMPKAEALAALLEAEMGMDVAVVVPTAYEPLIEGLRFGHIDAAYMDSGPAWLAHTRADAEVVLAEVKKGNTFYYGELFTRAGSEIDSLEDILGKKIAFTSYTGSSGFVFPMGTLIQEGLITPDGNDFASLEAALDDAVAYHTVSGGYQQSLALLLDGTVDVIGGAHDMPERFMEESERDHVSSFIRLGQVPSHPVVVASHVSSCRFWWNQLFYATI